MDFLDTAFKIQIWPAETMSDALKIFGGIALVVFMATALLRIWWTLSTWKLRRRKLRLEVEQAELLRGTHARVTSSKER
jgi:hypothetical protein